MSVELILDRLAANRSMKELIENCPGITQEDIWTVAFAANFVRNKSV